MAARPTMTPGLTGVYPPFDSDFAKCVRERLDGIGDEELLASIERYKSEPGKYGSTLVTLESERKRRGI